MAILRGRIAAAQLRQIVHRQRVIILFEGWVGAGKKAALQALAGALDPCFFTTHCVTGRTNDPDDRHWFAPFWAALPAAGHTSLFFRSWYLRAVMARASGRVDDKAWARMLDEINEFEAQQRDHGTIVIKFFFHVTPEVQRQRTRAVLDDPWRRLLLTDEEMSRIADRTQLAPFVEQIFDQTDTRWAPWSTIDAADQRAAQVACLGHVADVLDKAIPSTLPAGSAEIVDFPMARRADR